jgi:hypothetical protein
VERVAPKLTIEGIPDELQPEGYREDLEETGLMIVARLRVSPALGERIRERWRRNRVDSGYFAVTREGRDEERRRMRFGQGYWSDHGDHEKDELVLVDSSWDERAKLPRWPEAPMEQNERALVIRTAQRFESLLGALVERGHLSQEEADAVRDLSEERFYEGLIELRQVDDLDEWEG